MSRGDFLHDSTSLRMCSYLTLYTPTVNSLIHSCSILGTILSSKDIISLFSSAQEFRPTSPAHPVIVSQQVLYIDSPLDGVFGPTLPVVSPEYTFSAGRL